MKKKILMFMIALFMFIPLTIVKADELDDIIERLNQRIYFSDSYIRQVGSNITATKVDGNKLKVTVTTDMSETYSSWPEGFIDDEEMTFTSFITYEYQNSTLSYKGSFGYVDADDNTVDYKTTDKDAWAELLAAQNEHITKEILYVLYSLKTNEGYPTISTYLKSVGLEKENGSLSYPTTNLPEEIIITKDGEGWVTNYSINLNEINIPETTNTNTNTNTDNNTNNQTNTITDNKKNYQYTTENDRFLITFSAEEGKEFSFVVGSLMDRKKLIEEKNTESLRELTNSRIENLKEELNDNGTFIDLYQILVKEGEENKTKGTFTFKIKITDEMKEFDTFYLVNTVDDRKTDDIVQMKIDGDYLVGELPHLSYYALVGRKTENPKTGITKYTIPGVILLLGTFGVYALYKKKNEI